MRRDWRNTGGRMFCPGNPGKLLSYEAILAGLGENPIKATSGNEALEQLLKNDIAVILIDVNMPEMDGFELAAMIRQHPRFEQTALVLISAVQMTDLDQLRIGVPGARPAGPSGFTGCRTRAQGGLGRLKA